MGGVRYWIERIVFRSVPETVEKPWVILKQLYPVGGLGVLIVEEVKRFKTKKEAEKYLRKLRKKKS